MHKGGDSMRFQLVVVIVVAFNLCIVVVVVVAYPGMCFSSYFPFFSKHA